MTPSSRSSAAHPDDESARFPSWVIPAVIVLALLGGAGVIGTYAAGSDKELSSRLSDGVATAQQAVTLWEREELARAETWASDAALAGSPTSIPGPLATFAKNAASTDGIRAVALFTPQGALKTVAEMVERGYVERRDDAEDQRVRRLYLTDRGKAALRAARLYHSRIEREFARVYGASAVESAREVLGALAGRPLRADH